MMEQSASTEDLIHEDHGESRGNLIHGDHFAVGIKNSDEELVSSMKEKMEGASPSLCIYKVPENLRKGKETSFRPEIISIGPFHYREEGLKGMEEHKWQYLRALLFRKPNLEAGIDGCVKAIRQLEERARKCYEDSISLSSNEFVEMMIVDGCFIIELFLKYASKGLRRRGDPIFNKNWMLFSLRSDMILLENQLPLFVLQRLFELVPVPKQCDQTLGQLAFRFFKLIIPGDKEVLQKKFSQDGNHLLDLILNCYLPTLPRIPVKQNGAQKNINSAEKLKESGLKLKKVKEMSDSLLDIMFVNGVLELPPLQVHNYTEALFRNLIALEHCYKDCPMHVTSYALFMGGLIQSPKDVQLLRKRGIVTNCLGNDDIVVPALFKKLCNEVTVQDFYYAGICGQVNAYDGRTNKCSHCF